MPKQTKPCQICGAEFDRNPNYSNLQWSRQTYCSKPCAEESKRKRRRLNGTATCRICGGSGPFHEYTTSSGRRSRRETCVKCLNEARKPKRKTVEQRAKDSEYTRKFRARMSTSEPHRITHSKSWAEKNPEKYLYFRMLCNARKSAGRIIRNITFEQFLHEIGGSMPEMCPIFGIKLTFLAPPKSDCIPTVDRIDSSRSYEPGNIAIISWRANIIKNMGTSGEHRRIAEWIEMQSR